MVMIQDHLYRRVDVLGAIVVLMDMWPDVILCDLWSLLIYGVLGVAYTTRSASGVDVLILFCLIARGTYVAWSIICIASIMLLVLYGTLARSLPLFGMVAGLWLLLV